MRQSFEIKIDATMLLYHIRDLNSHNQPKITAHTQKQTQEFVNKVQLESLVSGNSSMEAVQVYIED